ncbi:hypothetical protein PR003_g4126 [Phytophthora rubi]|uniref:No apical meristem-associated C-terminal domain-containing protein n=1 Tax=Phytophthora rubi TaxID=129364 RepID=A0A6A3GVI5_9STRA|nr:hypothetical protein PR002_g30043 [Phytophthora rubi]KAE9352915.1 hypothetical protein PR003_g4126 [Phytophthora rubi]
MPNATPWSVEEDVRLCKAYTNISEDGATSTDQNATAFWDRIHATYSQLGATDTVARKPGALQTRWAGLIRPDVALYASCLAAVEAQQRSGWTEQDYTNEAANRFTAKREQLNANALREYNEGVSSGSVKGKRKPRLKPETFRLLHCFNVLRGCVRFMRDIPTPRKRPCQPSEHDESGLLDDDGADSEDSDKQDTGEATLSSMDTFQSPVGVLHAVRPTSAGKKKAKQLHFEEQVDKVIMHSQRELAVATSAQVEIMREQLQVAKKRWRSWKVNSEPSAIKPKWP